MKILKKTADLFIAFLCLIFCSGLLQSGQIYPLHEKSALPLSNCVMVSPQENTKYLYVGMKKCASECHNNKEMGFQYDIVKSSPHADAYRLLLSEKAKIYSLHANLSENPAESQICLKCHITGAGLDSSFFATTYRKDDGVTCEACHKGAFIKKTSLPKEADCLTCHNSSVHETPPFNFKENCAKIAHPRPKA